MVTSGSVNSSKESVLQGLNQYATETSGLESIWKGKSYESLSSQMAEVSSEFKSAIETNMTNFAIACDKYDEYINTKKMIESNKNDIANWEKQKASGDYDVDKCQANINEANKNIAELEQNLQDIEKAIKSALSTAKGAVLKASPQNISGSFMVGAGNLGATSGELTSARLGAKGRPKKSGFFGSKNIYDLNSGADPEGGNCTYYTWGRASELIGKPLVDSAHQWGNAGTWYANCTQYNKGSQPKLGAIAVWKGGSQGWGHVAVVEKIDSDGTIHTSEGAWSSGTWYKNNTYSKSNNYTAFGSYRLQGFIYPNEPKKA